MKKNTRRLTVTREIIRSLRPLEPAELRRAGGAGGGAVDQGNSNVEICTLTTTTHSPQ